MGMTKNKDMGRKKWRGVGDLVDLNLQMGSKLITFLAFSRGGAGGHRKLRQNRLFREVIRGWWGPGGPYHPPPLPPPLTNNLWNTSVPDE